METATEVEFNGHEVGPGDPEPTVRDGFGSDVLRDDDDALKTKAIDHDNNNTVEPMEVVEEEEKEVTTYVEASLDTQCVQDTLRELFVATDATSTEETLQVAEEDELVEEVTEQEQDEVEEVTEQEQVEVEEVTEQEQDDEEEEVEFVGEVMQHEHVEEEEVEEVTAAETEELASLATNEVEEEEVATYELDIEEDEEVATEEVDIEEGEEVATEEVDIEEGEEVATEEVDIAEDEEVATEEVEQVEVEGTESVDAVEEASTETSKLVQEFEEEFSTEKEKEVATEVERVEINVSEMEFVEQVDNATDESVKILQETKETELQCAEVMPNIGDSRAVDEAQVPSSEENLNLHQRELEDILPTANELVSKENETLSIKVEKPDMCYNEQSPVRSQEEEIERSDDCITKANVKVENNDDEEVASNQTSSFEVFIKQEVGEERVTADPSEKVAVTNANSMETATIEEGTSKTNGDRLTEVSNGLPLPSSITTSEVPAREAPECDIGYFPSSFSEIHRLPFERGWKREIVHRSVVMTGSKWKSVDVYYFTPAGRKMRSLREVAEYLDKNNEETLSAVNFSFSKRKVSTSPLETARTAKKRGAPSSADAASVLAKKPCPNVMVVPNKPRPEAAKRKQILQPNAQLGMMKPVALPKGISLIGKRKEGELTTEVKRCSNHCPGQQGVIPTVQCKKCLCLFHPRCVGLAESFAGMAHFICRECVGSFSSLGSSPSLVRLLSPSARKTCSTNNSANIRPSMNPSIGRNTNRVACRNVMVTPVRNTQNQATNFRDAKHFPCGVTIEKIPPGAKPVPSELPTASISVIPMSRPLLFSRPPTSTNAKSIIRPELSPSRGTHANYLFPNLTNAMMMASVKSRMTPEQQMQKRMTPEGQMQNNYRVQAVTLPVPAQNLHAYSKKIDQRTNVNTCVIQSRLPMSATEHSYNKTRLNNNGQLQVSIVRPKRFHSSSNPTNCFVSSLNGGFASLLKIFKYLSLPDLLRASQVCSTWRDVSKHCSVWETVVLKNVKVRNWEMFARCAPSLGIQRLDLRGMPISENRDATFRGILLLLSKIKNLHTLQLCEVPAYIVHTVMNQHPSLKCFTAEWITEGNKDNAQNKCNLDLGKFGKVLSLKTLQIRGIYGIYLVGDSLKELGSLNRLTRLCVTSLRDAPSCQYAFLNSLPNLKTLELGECIEWTEEVYQAISHLTKLTTLRLEFGGKCAERGMEIVLSSLRNLVRLELIIFRIPPNFGELLEEMRNLRHMTIWPDMQIRPDHNNYNTVRATKFIPFVKTLMWGLVTSTLHENQTGAGGESHRIDHNSCCIPFLTFSLDSTMPARMHISAHQLMNKLRSELPQAKVQVVMVPNSSYRTIAYMPR